MEKNEKKTKEREKRKTKAVLMCTKKNLNEFEVYVWSAHSVFAVMRSQKTTLKEERKITFVRIVWIVK